MLVRSKRLNLARTHRSGGATLPSGIRGTSAGANVALADELLTLSGLPVKAADRGSRRLPLPKRIGLTTYLALHRRKAEVFRR